MTGERRRVEIITTLQAPMCPRCNREGLLQALVPHTWANSSGVMVQGRCGVVLCSWCDADAPHAAPLITWFHVHGRVQDDIAEEFALLLHDWADHVQVPALDEHAWEAEIELWRRGEL